MSEAARATYEAAGFQCQAEGLHAKNCPGKVTDDNARSFIVHHIYPVAQAKKFGIPRDKIDVPWLLAAIWNGYTGLGAGGCHGRIHNEQSSARTLGLLVESNASVYGDSSDQTTEESNS